jgi:hypothetical protein
VAKMSKGLSIKQIEILKYMVAEHDKGNEIIPVSWITLNVYNTHGQRAMLYSKIAPPYRYRGPKSGVGECKPEWIEYCSQIQYNKNACASCSRAMRSLIKRKLVSYKRYGIPKGYRLTNPIVAYAVTILKGPCKTLNA